VVKHVVKGEKWACLTLEAGKNKPIMIIAKTRDFKRFSEKIKENGTVAFAMRQSDEFDLPAQRLSFWAF